MADDQTGTAVTEDSAALETQPDTTTSDASTTQASEAQAPSESFISDEELLNAIQQDPKLKHFYGKMQGNYGRYRTDLKEGRAARETIQKFYSDREFALKTIQQLAPQLGLHIVPQGQQAPAGQTGSVPEQVPPHVVERIKSQLAPELQWMAPQLAQASWVANREAIRPLEEQRTADLKLQKEQQYEEAAAELDTKYPGWDERESELQTLLGWLQGGPMKHAKYGSRLEALYKLDQLLSGHNGAAVGEAARRMAQAAKSRTTSGQVTSSVVPDHTQKIRQAKTRQEAFEIAAQVGLEEARKLGANL